MDPTLLEHARAAIDSCRRRRPRAPRRRPRDRGCRPLLEVSTYCGSPPIYLGAARARPRTVAYTVDHHRGSEENQPGWVWHDERLVDPATGRLDTLPWFRRTIAAAGLEDVVVAVVGDSPTVGRHWATPLGLLFIDGGHAYEVALADYETWAPHVAPGRPARVPRRVRGPRRRGTGAVPGVAAGRGRRVRPGVHDRVAARAAALTLSRGAAGGSRARARSPRRRR